MPIGAAIGISTGVGLYSSKKSAQAQEKGVSQASDMQYAINRDNIAANKQTLDKIIALQDKTLADQKAEAKPWRDIGIEALDYVKRGFDEGWLQQEQVKGLEGFDFKKFDYIPWEQREFGGNGRFQQKDFQGPDEFDYDKFQAPEKFQYNAFNTPAPYQRPEFNFEEDPGYQFRKEEGMDAIATRAAQRGRNASPATDKVMQRYVQGLASQEYGNSFNRYLSETDREYGQYSDDYSRSRSAYDTDRSFDYGQYSDDYSRDRYNFDADRGFEYGKYSDDYTRKRQAYESDRSFAYGRYADEYARDWNKFQYGEDRRYDTYQKVGQFEADQHWKMQGLDYSNYLDMVNSNNSIINSRNASKMNMLNTAMNFAGVGQNATSQNMNANTNYSSNVTNAFNSMNNSNNASRTNAGNNMSNLMVARGQANPYSGYANSVNTGMENYLMYNMYMNG